MHEKVYVFDIEVYPNYFTVLFKNENDAFRFSFENIIETEKLENIRELIRGKVLIGWNNLEYDNPMMSFLLSGKVKTTQQLKNLSNELIEGRIPHKKVKEVTTLQDYGVHTIDIMKIVLGNVRKSLKATMIHYAWEVIEDLPYHHNKVLTKNEISHVDIYNENDVDMTLFLVKKNWDKIKLRSSIKKKYSLDSFVLSESDSGISNVLMEYLYSVKTNQHPYLFKYSRSNWKHITFNDVFIPMFEFEHPLFVEFFDKISQCVFVEDGKVLTDKYIQSQTGVFILPYDDYNLSLQFGSGGLHSIDDANYFESKEDELIVDDDVESYYPSILIEQELNPNHLVPVIHEIFSEKKQERVEAKRSGDIVTDSANKMILNSTTGKFNSPFSFLFDVRLYLQITVNCQLQTIKLIEMLYSKGFKVISANTDGVTSIIKKEQKIEYDEVVADWRKHFGYKTEQAIYSKYIRSNVNNYCAYIPSKDKWKKKGWFQEEKDVQKSFEYPVVTKAFFTYLINPVDDVYGFLDKFFKDYVKEHGVHDFCLSQIISKEFQNYLRVEHIDRTDVIPLQKTLRYYISDNRQGEGVLVKSKICEDKTTSPISFFVKHTKYHAKHKVTLYNVAFKDSEYNVNYEFYIQEALKVIQPIMKKKNEKV